MSGFAVLTARTDADRLLEGDREVAETLARRLLVPNRDNLVERPWGGTRLRPFKRLDTEGKQAERTVGESFELAADDADDEARRHPSILTLGDGSRIALPALLAVHAGTLLGEAFVERYGRSWPLLPKLLDVAELLSVQAHPPGNTEVYVIVEADSGATLRLGFATDVAAADLAASFAAGRAAQQRLIDLGFDAHSLQALLKPWLSRRSAKAEELMSALEAGASWEEVEKCLTALHEVYWRALDSLNAVPVHAGDVIYNSNPPRIVAATGEPASAEAHALGNPEGRAVLALEIRRPGTTYRAWDHVRFPLRDIDIEAALRALNLRATQPQEFCVEPHEVRPGVRRSVDCEYFRIEHLEPTHGVPVDVPRSAPHSLHALAGAVNVTNERGEPIGALARGESALVPVHVGAYRIVATEQPALLVKVEVPPYAA
jgi:mannose-6-phosphate isomerase class I